MWMLYSCAALAAGFLLDALLGDPQWLYHPIRLIGGLIAVLEKRLRKKAGDDRRKLRAAGRRLVIYVCLIVFFTAGAVSAAAYLINPYLYIAVESVMCYFLLAARSLETESMKVYRALEKNDTEAARHAVSMIVGRDTNSLDRSGIIRAAVETVAENASDGVIAPLFYTAIGGAPIGFLYKAINTMDSMVGYKNDKYIDFGRCAAKTDDVVNFIPARLSAALMLVSALITGADFKNAVRIYRRDRYKHASPNSAHTEAVCAGALNVRLAGDAVYFGKLLKKEFIGDDMRPIENRDIKRANRLMYCASVLALMLAAAAKAALYYLVF